MAGMCVDDRDCPYRSVCFRDYSTNDPLSNSYCSCELFYGYVGEECNEYGPLTYLSIMDYVIAMCISITAMVITIRSLRHIISCYIQNRQIMKKINENNCCYCLCYDKEESQQQQQQQQQQMSTMNTISQISYSFQRSDSAPDRSSNNNNKGMLHSQTKQQPSSSLSIAQLAIGSSNSRQNDNIKDNVHCHSPPRNIYRSSRMLEMSDRHLMNPTTSTNKIRKFRKNETSFLPKSIACIEKYLVSPIIICILYSLFASGFLILLSCVSIYGIVIGNTTYEYFVSGEMKVIIKDFPEAIEEMRRISTSFTMAFTVMAIAQLFFIWVRVLRHQLARGSFDFNVQKVKRLEYFCGAIIIIIGCVCMPLIIIGYSAYPSLILTLLMGILCAVLFCLYRAAKQSLENFERYQDQLMKNLVNVLKEIKRLSLLAGSVLALIFLTILLYGILAIDGWRYGPSKTVSVPLIITFFLWPALGACLLLVSVYSHRNVLKTYKLNLVSSPRSDDDGDDINGNDGNESEHHRYHSEHHSEDHALKVDSATLSLRRNTAYLESSTSPTTQKISENELDLLHSASFSFEGSNKNGTSTHVDSIRERTDENNHDEETKGEMNDKILRKLSLGNDDEHHEEGRQAIVLQ